MSAEALHPDVLEGPASGYNVPRCFIFFIAVPAFGVRVVEGVGDMFVSSHEAVACYPPDGFAKGVFGALHDLF